MFQSIALTKYLGYDEKTKLNSYEYELTDSDFTCVVAGVAVAGGGVTADEVGTIIQEYTKRNLNVAYNLLLYFRWYEEETEYSIADQIERAEYYQSLFTPKLKTDIEKYKVLL